MEEKVYELIFLNSYKIEIRNPCPLLYQLNPPPPPVSAHELN